MAIIKRNIGALFTKHNIESIIITEQAKKQCQHELCNFTKKILKSNVDKGPDGVKVSFSENMLIIVCEKYMTKYEKYIMSVNPSDIEVLHEARVKVNNSFFENKFELDEFVFKLLGAKILGFVYDVCLEEDFALWVIILDKNIVVE